MGSARPLWIRATSKPDGPRRRLVGDRPRCPDGRPVGVRLSAEGWENVPGDRGERGAVTFVDGAVKLRDAIGDLAQLLEHERQARGEIIRVLAQSGGAATPPGVLEPREHRLQFGEHRL
jgi:hypothetical protein